MISIEYLFLIPVLTWVYLFVFGPVTKNANISSNARNNIFRILMSNKLSDYRAAIWAQEYYESRHKLVNPLALFRVNSALRKMEIMGHEIEVQAAKIFYDLKDVDAYRKLEALSLSRNYSQFEGYSKESIESDMIKVSSRASSFVRKNREKIQKQM